MWSQNECNQASLIRTPKGQSLMSDIQIYRSGVCYLGTCNRKGVHKENFDCLWDPEWCTLESKVSFIASLQVDFLREAFPYWPITHPKKDFKKFLPAVKKRSLHSNLHSLNPCKLRKSILATICSLNLCFESRDLDWACALRRRRIFKKIKSLR